MAAIAAGVGAAASIAGTAGSLASSSGASSASRKAINQGIGLTSKETGFNDRFNASLFTPYISQANTYGQRLNDELLGGSLSRGYDWNRYRMESGMPSNLEQQDFLRQYTPQDFGQALGNPSFSIADLYKSMTPDDFRGTYGYDLKNAGQQYTPGDFQAETGYDMRKAGQEYDPSRFAGQYGYDLAKVGQEYDPAKFRAQYGYDLADAGKQYDADKFQQQYGYSLSDALQNFTSDSLASDPGYQFRRDQGAQALDRIAAARGGVLGGGQVKAQQRYAQDYASNEFSDAYARDAERKQMALGQFNQAYNSDMANRQGMAGIYQSAYNQDAQNRQAMGQLYQGAYGQDMANRQGMMDQYNARYGQDLANRQTMLGQWNTAYANDQNDLTRKQGLYFGMADRDTEAKTRQLQNYYDAMKATQVGNAQKYDQLKGMYDSANQMVGAYAGLRQNNSNSRTASYTGGATAQAQNAWNKGQAQGAAWGGLGNNLSSLAGMYMATQGGGGFGDWFGGHKSGALNGGTKGTVGTGWD
jgi:hypothetical protein